MHCWFRDGRVTVDGWMGEWKERVFAVDWIYTDSLQSIPCGDNLQHCCIVQLCQRMAILVDEVEMMVVKCFAINSSGGVRYWKVCYSLVAARHAWRVLDRQTA